MRISVAELALTEKNVVYGLADEVRWTREVVAMKLTMEVEDCKVKKERKI